MPQSEIVPLPPTSTAYSLAEIERLAEAIAESGMFGIKTKAQALVLMAISQAEGRHPALAARDYDIINGEPAKKAEAIQRDFLSAGGTITWHELTDKKADATFSHPIGGTKRFDWDMARVAQAGLASKPMYAKYPRAMLRARCISEGVKAIWPAATSGMYTPEEQADIPIRDAQPAPISAAADLDQFARDDPPLPPLQQPSLALPRSDFWQDASYRMEPNKIQFGDLKGKPNWRAWVDDIVYLISQASGDEIDKLRADNRDLLATLRRENGDLFREITDAAVARRADLNAGAPA